VLLAVFWEMLGKLDGDLVNAIANRILGAGITAVVVAYIVVVVGWVIITKQYKKDLLALRYGEQKRFTFEDKTLKDYEYAEASPLPGLVIWRSVLTFIIVFFPVFIILFIISWDWFWILLWEKLSGLAIGVVSLSAFQELAITGVKKFSVKQNWIANRRLYAVYEFVILFIGFAAGVVSGIGQLIAAISSQFAAFARIDKRAYPGDKGFEAYAAMVREDHEWNSPCVRYAIATYKTLLPKQPSAAASTADKGDTEKGTVAVAPAAKEVLAINRLQALYTLLNNEDLLVGRKGERPGAEAAVHGRASTYGKTLEKKEEKDGKKKSSEDIELSSVNTDAPDSKAV
jgi:hypothetical protein